MAEARRLQRCAVFAGATLGNDPAFAIASADAGRELATQKITMVLCGPVSGLLQVFFFFSFFSFGA